MKTRKFKIGDRVQTPHPYVRRIFMADATVIRAWNDGSAEVLFDDIPISHGAFSRSPDDLTLVGASLALENLASAALAFSKAVIEFGYDSPHIAGRFSDLCEACDFLQNLRESE